MHGLDARSHGRRGRSIRTSNWKNGKEIHGNCNDPKLQPIQFAGSSLGNCPHVCAFFNSPKEEYETLLPFVRAGLEGGERAYHVLPGKYRDEHLEQLRNAGIDVEKAQQTRQLEIALPGTGLEAHNLERVFKAFYTTKPQGIGIGLSISRSIIEAHGGQLWAVQNDGPGVTFHFTLPIYRSVAA